MFITTSISQFRNNIALYLERVVNGMSVVIRDEKKGTAIAKILPVSAFDSEQYQHALQKYSGILTAQAHPEWETGEQIEEWVHTSRSSDERNFQ